MNATTRSIATVAGLVLAVMLAPGAASAAAAPAPHAACLPSALLTGAAPDGEVMWITNAGLAVGGVATGEVIDDQEVFAAAYWTHDGAGYHVHSLPKDPLVNDEILDVNESGRMVDYGFNLATGNSETYVYDLPTNTWWHLPTFGGSDTRGRRINASGVVAGGGDDRHGIGFAATWSPPYTSVNRLPQVGQFPYAPGINDAGVTVGATNQGRYTPAIDPTVRHLQIPHLGYFPLTTPVQWAANGAPSTLTTLFSEAEAFAINDAGTVVGGSDTPDFGVDAAYWQHGVVHDMGGQPGYFTEARGLSQGGWATGGSASFSSPHGQAFVWTGAGTLQYLPALSGPDGDSNAHGVNDVLRQVGGWSDDGSGHTPPTIWQCPAGFTTG